MLRRNRISKPNSPLMLFFSFPSNPEGLFTLAKEISGLYVKCWKVPSNHLCKYRRNTFHRFCFWIN
ncbi:hypothetical protein I7I50_11801 [Histoplasma capsulatum G186AR]|uniref:Uncharacterized protein n=1 Tax=Ajellomyces capsulatus TaxID=5037 RepID=A0A8H8D7A2_AJECA|nr:hypothetical protein I7I52_03039 [Histoplasma capsulatum]QSS70238.1 hypothetical protein I7I50_11801 [Histoplasma capsulatum G186AR]